MQMTTLIVKDVKSVKKALEILQMYCKGQNVYTENSVHENRRGENIQKLFPFKEEENVKMLGVRIGKKMKE